MTQRRHVFLLGFLLLALGLVATITAEPALAAPPHADKPGYTMISILTADPTTADYTASYTPDVKSIYAWVLVVAEKGAAEKPYQVDVQFTSPDGQSVDSQWYKGDSGKVTTIPRETYDTGKWAAKNVARRQLDIAGTDNANLTGQWSVNFLVGGKSVTVENFTLASSGDVEMSDAEVAAKSSLEKQGYTVDKLGTVTWDDGTVVGYVKMPMVSTDLYSAQTSKQLVDGFGALRSTYPKATVLLNELGFSDRYDLVYMAKVADWDAYVKSQNFSKLWSALVYLVWDNNAQEYLESAGAKDFVKKNFGAGTPKSPATSNTGKDTGAIGSVKVQVSPSSLPADGSSTADIAVTVFDKKNKPLPNTDLTFTVSGSGAGSIRPKATSTDAKGNATATFTAGSKTGTVTITAAAGKTTGAAVVTLGDTEGGGGSNDQADNVRTDLAAQGYTVIDVAYVQENSAALVAIDLGSGFTQNDVVSVIFYGSLTLRKYYPEAKYDVTVVPYQGTTLIYLIAAAADVDKYVKAANAAKGDKSKSSAALQSFINGVVANSYLYDTSTGKVVGTFKDFAQKNFGGG